MGQTVATEALVLLYDKSSLREYINRKARLGSHGILFTKTGGQLELADAGCHGDR